MSTFRDWEAYKRLKNRADTNSVVDVLKNKSTGDLIVRKIIYGIEQPLYQAVFTREKEKVGVIYLPLLGSTV